MLKFKEGDETLFRKHAYRPDPQTGQPVAQLVYGEGSSKGRSIQSPDDVGKAMYLDEQGNFLPITALLSKIGWSISEGGYYIPNDVAELYFASPDAFWALVKGYTPEGVKKAKEVREKLQFEEFEQAK